MSDARPIVTVDVGGTHVRFAIARIAAGRVVRLDPAVTLRTRDHADFGGAWAAFAAARPGPLPREAAIAVAGPVGGDTLRLTNHPWTIRPATLAAELGLDRLTLVNDFGAVGHAVANCPAEGLVPLCGPDRPLPDSGVIAIVGPGTGLGVACLVRHAQGYEVIETEGGHAGFAPLDPIEDVLLARLRARHGRVSVERVVAGAGLAAIHEALAAHEGRHPIPAEDDRALWDRALGGGDPLAAAALDRFCMSLGSVAGDIALAQGAGAVVVAGGLGARLAAVLPRSGFDARFAAKGRMRARMEAIPVKLLVLPEPGLFGAAVAHALRHRERPPSRLREGSGVGARP